MNLAEAPAIINNIKVVASSTPTDRLTFDVSGANITLPASDVARLVIDHLLRATQPSAATLPASAGQITSADAPPRIGAVWAAEGGVYAGIVRGDEGKPDHHLIVAEAQPDGPLPWKDAMEWAQGFVRNFTLPDRKEQAVLYGNVPELFEKAWYWSRETVAGNPEYAWSQYFDFGTQDNGRKDYELRARAVRRVPIQ